MSPSYILVTQYLKLTDTIWALILPSLIAPFYIFLLRAFCSKIPTSLIESAKIDGANEFYILYKIIVPLAKPAIATVTFFMVLGKWNDWLNGLLYIRTASLLPLQTLLQRIMAEIAVLTTNLQNMPAGLSQSAKIPENTVLMAMAVLASGPMLFAFPFFQKYFVKGLTVGAIKG
jgi:putative aldouronate transport system permease protein